jgi:MFS family permease
VTGWGTVSSSRIRTPQYRWYVAAQCVSLVGSSMSSAALYWLAIQVAHGNGLLLSAVVAAQFIPFLVFSRQAGSIVAKHRPARLLTLTQVLQMVLSLAFAVPLFAGWMPAWYLCPLALVLGFVLTVDVPARQMLMLDLVGPEELRRGASRRTRGRTPFPLAAGPAGTDTGHRVHGAAPRGIRLSV